VVLSENACRNKCSVARFSTVRGSARSAITVVSVGLLFPQVANLHATIDSIFKGFCAEGEFYPLDNYLDDHYSFRLIR